MVKMPSTIYRAVVEDAVSRGVHEIPYEIMKNAFINSGYGETKAQYWIKKLVCTNNHTLVAERIIRI